jgi:hypothetical protein
MALLDELGQDILPEIFSALESEGIVGTMSIVSDTLTTDGAGGLKRTAGTTDYTDVPVTYKARVTFRNDIDASQQRILRGYELTFPVYHAGERITLDIDSQVFTIAARGLEPAKTFRPISVDDGQGVRYKVFCEKE